MEEFMPVKDPKEVFLMLLSHVRQGTEKSAKFYDEIGDIAKDPQIKEAIEARAFVSKSVLAKLDECFRILGEKPTQLSGELREMLIEEFRKEFNEIQSPVARRLYVLAKLIRLTHMRIGEYVALTAAADLAGHHGVAVLLETCLADKLAFVERNRRLIRRIAEERVAERLAA
jgi:ferritin-like metal-binding protein YciE